MTRRPPTRRPSPEALREAARVAREEAITGHKARAMVVKYAGAARQKQRATTAQKRRK